MVDGRRDLCTFLPFFWEKVDSANIAFWVKELNQDHGTNFHIPKTRNQVYPHIFRSILGYIYIHPSFTIIISILQSILFILKMPLRVFCQLIWQNRCKITLVAFVWFFSTVQRSTDHRPCLEYLQGGAGQWSLHLET